MFRKITSLVLAASVMLLVQFADCLAMSAGQDTMQCCRTMPCGSANHSHDCCKETVSAPMAGVLPHVRIPLGALLAIKAGSPRVAQVTRSVELISPGFEPQQVRFRIALPFYLSRLYGLASARLMPSRVGSITLSTGPPL